MKQRTIKTPIFQLLGLALLTGILLISCSEDPEGDSNIVDQEVRDLDGSLNSVFDGKIFSIPSPIQTALLIKELNLPFNESLLNDDANAKNYVTEHKQALNLGIYGADLGYASIYEEKGYAMRYLATIKTMTSELGLSGAFDENFMKRFEKNNENQDSMVQLMSDAFSRADEFLKKSDRKAVSALVLAGGWIESMYFSVELNHQKKSDKMIRRIGEQRETLETLIDMLKEYNKGKKNDALIAELTDLKVSFDKFVINYEYEAPETDAKKKITTLTHRLTVKIPPAVLTEVRTKITAIRNNIIKT